jgi:hypothetical protein
LRIMRIGFRRVVSWVAIYAVALHVILLGFAPIAANGSAAVDPFTVICHSGVDAGALGDEAPSKPNLIPGHACDQCNLCNAAAPPPAPGSALLGSLLPARVLHALRPLSTTVRIGTTSDPKLARGPPLSV